MNRVNVKRLEKIIDQSSEWESSSMAARIWDIA